MKTTHLLTRYTHTILARRWIVLGVVAVVLVLAATGFARLEYDTTYRIWFEEDSEHLAKYDELLSRFGSDDTALVMLTDDESLFHNGALGAIQSLADRLWQIDGVKRVDALTNFSVARANRVEHESAALAFGAGFVAAAGDDGAIDVFFEDGRHDRLEGHTGVVEHLVADGATLYSAALDRSVRVWDVHEGVQRVVRLRDPISALALTDGALLVGTLDAFVVYTRDGATERLRRAADGFVTHLVADQQLFVVANGVSVYDADFTAVRTFANDRPALDVAVDGGTLYTAHDDGRVYAHGATSRLVYDARAPAIAVAAEDGALYVGTADGALHTVRDDIVAQEILHRDWITDIAVHGDRIVTGSRDRDVTLLAHGVRTVLPFHRAPVRRVALEGDRLYTLGDDGDLYVFERGEVVARHRRTTAKSFVDRAPSGDERAAVAITNGFRFDVVARIAERELGTIAAGSSARFEGIAIAAPTPCDAGCGAGQYCDWERTTPTCTTAATIRLFDPEGAEIDAAEVYLHPDQTSHLEMPSDDAFSVSAAVAPPTDPRMTTAAFIDAFPATRDALAPYGDVFIAPDLAEALAAKIEGPREARELLTTFARTRPSPLALPMQPRRIAELQHLMTRPPDPPAFGAVLNPALDATLFVVAVHQPSDDGALERSKRVTNDLRAVIDEAKAETGFGVHLTGSIVQETVMEEYAQREIDRLLPLFFAVLAIMLIVVYRRPAGLLVPLGLVVAAIGFSMGLAGHLGASLNNMTVVGPQVVLAACIGDAVHLFNTYADRLRGGDSVPLATKHAVRDNFMPCLWTSASTSLGFFSLCTSKVVPVATFGWIAGIGVLTAFVLSFTLMPALLGLLPVPKAAVERPWLARFDGVVDRALGAFGRWVNHNTSPILAVGAGAIVLALVGLSDLRFEASELGAFRDDAPILIATNLIEDRELSGAYGLQIVADTKTPGGVRSAEHLEAVAALEAHLEAMPEVKSVVSLTDIHRRMNRVMHQDEPAFYRLPEDDETISAHYDAFTFSLEAGRNLSHRVSSDEGATVLDLRLESQTSTWLLAWGDRLDAWAATNVPGLELTITSKSWLVTNTVTEIAAGFVKNVGSAVLVISLLVLLAAGSFRIGLPACIANVLPVGVMLGLIAVRGQTMDISAIVSCCVAMGIVVDDTLHFMARYRSARERCGDHDAAVLEAMHHSGKAMLFTTIILVVGFSIFMLADYKVSAKFGSMSASILLFGLIFDLTLLPAALKIAHWRRAPATPAERALRPRAGSGVY
ncbi:MAG: MMPL family transporter [Deltaproteobacteria bacterium]